MNPIQIPKLYDISKYVNPILEEYNLEYLKKYFKNGIMLYEDDYNQYNQNINVLDYLNFLNLKYKDPNMDIILNYIDNKIVYIKNNNSIKSFYFRINYNLDLTNISKLDIYLILYSKDISNFNSIIKKYNIPDNTYYKGNKLYKYNNIDILNLSISDKRYIMHYLKNSIDLYELIQDIEENYSKYYDLHL